MKMKKTLSFLLALCFLLGLAPALGQSAGAEGERSVSPWAAEEIRRAESYGLLDVGALRRDYAAASEPVTDWAQPITRAMFVRFALSYAAVMNHSDRECFQMAVNRLISERSEDGHFLKYPFTDDATPEVAAAYALGIVEGRGGGIFDPDALISRQEAAAVLCRAYEACSGDAAEAGEAQPFADEEEIASWALDAVHILRSRDVLRGMGDGRFDPQGDFTIEQCAVCFLRLSEEMPVSFLQGNVPPRFTQAEAISAIQPDDGILRWDGPLAVFLSRSQGMVLGSTTYFLIYADGGIRMIPQAVPRHNYAFPFDTAGFSEDGRTFTYTVTVAEDEYDTVFRDGEPAERVLLAEAGWYTVTIDVASASQTVERVPLTPREGRWDDVPADAWYREAAEYCAELELLPDAEARLFDPDGAVSRGLMVETVAHIHSYLTTGSWSLPLRPADWGVAVLRLEDGRELEAFRAWEQTQWRTWTGPMNKEPWHYSIRSSASVLTELFPELEESGSVYASAVLDMGDKQVPGLLGATLAGDLEDGGPALLFYPEETSDYKDGGLLEPGAPTLLFQCALPGGEGAARGIYYFAEKDIWWETQPSETALGWELAYFLCRLYQDGGLPEETFRPIYDVTLAEGTDWGQYLEPLYRAGILRQDDPGFDPAAPVTRALFAAVLWRLLEPGVR